MNAFNRYKNIRVMINALCMFVLESFGARVKKVQGSWRIHLMGSPRGRYFFEIVSILVLLVDIPLVENHMDLPAIRIRVCINKWCSQRTRCLHHG